MDLTPFRTVRLDLKRPLLVIAGSQGTLACGYLNVATFEKLGEAGAIVTGVGSFESMLDAEIQAASPAAAALGVTPGMTGRQALERFR